MKNYKDLPQTPKRLFSNRIIEALTRTNSFIPIFFFILLSIGIVIYRLVVLDTFHWYMIGYYLLGLLVFTLIEYLIHRFVYHSGDYQKEGRWQYKVHGIHHVHPKDKERLAMPLPLAMVLAAGFFYLFRLLMPDVVYFFFPGFILGYALYLLIHYLIHAMPMPRNIFDFLWTNHAIHHYKDGNRAFGVSSPIWDIVFRTIPKKDYQ